VCPNCECIGECEQAWLYYCPGDHSYVVDPLGLAPGPRAAAVDKINFARYSARLGDRTPNHLVDKAAAIASRLGLVSKTLADETTS
jgi:hypothetical protein